MMSVSLIIMGACVIFIYLPVFYNLQLSSAYEYLELRFDRKVKLLASILYAVGNMSFLPVVIYAPSLSLNQSRYINIIILILF